MSAKITAANELTELEEERIAKMREILLNRISDASEKVKNSEQQLVDARNELPPLNEKIIAAERQLASVRENIRQANSALIAASQSATDAQAQYTFQIGMARAQATLAASSFGDVVDAQRILNETYEQTTILYRTSSQEILNIRRQLVQEEINLLRGQIDAVKNFAMQAATATGEELAKMQAAITAANLIARGEATVQEINPELFSQLSSIAQAGIVPGFDEAALIQAGLDRLGLSFEEFKSAE
jgi:predicted  nucleic acid-binding Zn-ribbon protein